MLRSNWKSIKYSPFFIAFVGLIWFLVRVISRPTRIAYPCQRMALANISYVMGSAVVPYLVWHYRRLISMIRRNYFKVIVLASITAILVTAFQLYRNHRENQLRINGSRTIPELQERARFKHVTGAGTRESHPHDITMTKDAINYKASDMR